MSRTSYVRPLALVLAVAVAVSVVMVLWFALPVQAQSESTDSDAGDAPAQSESTDNAIGDEPQPTGKHIIVYSDTDTLPTDYEQRIANRGGKVEYSHPETGVVVASGLSEDEAESLESDEDVQAVDPDVEVQWLDPKQQPLVEEPSVEEASAEGTSEEVVPTSATAPHTASRYARQWNLREAIKANKAWEAGRLGSPDVTVAILDSGIDSSSSNRDLTGRIVDKDKDGNPLSTSFVESDDKIIQNNFPTLPLWTDLHFHGTHVASTVSSNAEFFAGVTSQVRLMGVKVLGANGSGPVSGVLKGIRHAADKEADVINMSLGSFFHKRTNPAQLEALNRAINYAHEKGMVVVVSAGNDAHDLTGDSDLFAMYCQAPHVVCVSATGPTSGGTDGPWPDVDARALRTTSTGTERYSNYGSPIVVAAPGGSVGGSVWALCPKTTIVTSLLSCRTSNSNLGLRGTSQAAPHVSGLAALLVEKIGKNKPSVVARQIRASADDLGDPKKDAYYGYGRINVAKALELQPSP